MLHHGYFLLGPPRHQHLPLHFRFFDWAQHAPHIPPHWKSSIGRANHSSAWQDWHRRYSDCPLTGESQEVCYEEGQGHGGWWGHILSRPQKQWHTKHYCCSERACLGRGRQYIWFSWFKKLWTCSLWPNSRKNILEDLAIWKLRIIAVKVELLFFLLSQEGNEIIQVDKSSLLRVILRSALVKWYHILRFSQKRVMQMRIWNVKHPSFISLTRRIICCWFDSL